MAQTILVGRARSRQDEDYCEGCVLDSSSLPPVSFSTPPPQSADL